MAIEPYQKIYLYKRVVQAKLFIDRHYAGNIELNNIADEAYFSKFHFIRLFKNIYGKTPHHYLTAVRVDRAKQLLSKDLSISQVCLSVGFESATTFTGLFKKLVGVPPSVFQKEQQKRQQKIESVPLHFIPNCFAQSHGWTKNSNIGEVNS